MLAQQRAPYIKVCGEQGRHPGRTFGCALRLGMVVEFVPAQDLGDVGALPVRQGKPTHAIDLLVAQREKAK
jgi:hypothetical protein